MNGSIKANTVDRYLKPIRENIYDLIDSNSSVLEIACGNGDQLLLLSDKVKSGLGVDISPKLIDYAIKRKSDQNINNLDFICNDITDTDFDNKSYDFTIASLIFHILPYEDSKKILNRLINIADTCIICAFSKAENPKDKFLLWLDQRFNSHYKNFKKYQINNSLKGLLDSMDIKDYSEIDTFDPVIKIYLIKRR